MRIPTTLTLSQRIVALIFLGLLAGSWIVVRYSEGVLESAMLDQVKKQALVFLYGLEPQIQRLPQPSAPAALYDVLERGVRDHEYLDFSVYRLYVFDRDGRILADTRPGDSRKKDVSKYLATVFDKKTPYLSEEVEPYRDAATGRSFPITDVIIPLVVDGVAVAALEVELDLEETMLLIQKLDDSYEDAIMLIMGVAALLMLAFLWWVVNRGLIRPIQLLRRVTQRIAKGDLASRVDRLPRNELGDLGRSVNHMADSIQSLIEEQEAAYFQAMQSLHKALEAKDTYTASHSGRVTKYSLLLARRLGLAEDKLEILRQGALMHDLGKIGIPDAILNKPAALTDDEYEIMRAHPTFTATIMRPLRRLKEHAAIAAWHHERWDGNGYPDGLKGEDIPLLARIVAVADAWDAMTGDRVYRKGMPVAKAVSILDAERDSGQFDPHLIGVFIDMIRDEEQARAQVRADVAQAGAALPESGV